MQLLIDENLSPRIVRWACEAGYPAEAAVHVGLGGANVMGSEGSVGPALSGKIPYDRTEGQGLCGPSLSHRLCRWGIRPAQPASLDTEPWLTHDSKCA